jgi:hypothetical protein
MATVFALPIVRSVRRPLPPAPPVLAVLPAFALSDQTGRPFGPDQVRGQILIAEFVPAASLETGTASPLARLQKRVRNTGNAVHLVSFLKSAAPLGAADLKRLAAGARAGVSRWTLAAGEAGATEGLEARTIAALGAPKDFSASLEGRLLLVDGKGRIRRILGTTPDEIDLMMRDIGLLANLEGM